MICEFRLHQRCLDHGRGPHDENATVTSPSSLQTCPRFGMNVTAAPGSGVANADFVLYVTAVRTTRCKANVLALSRVCQLESKLDRYNDFSSRAVLPYCYIVLILPSYHLRGLFAMASIVLFTFG